MPQILSNYQINGYHKDFKKCLGPKHIQVYALQSKIKWHDFKRLSAKYLFSFSLYMHYMILHSFSFLLSKVENSLINKTFIDGFYFVQNHNKSTLKTSFF